MTGHSSTLAYGRNGVDTVPRTSAVVGAWPDAGDQLMQQRGAAERALDDVLADSFPASDPPPWTLGVEHEPPAADAAAATSAMEAARAAARRRDVLDVSLPSPRGATVLSQLVSVTGAMGIALLLPLVFLLVGVPLALLIRSLVRVATWLVALISG